MSKWHVEYRVEHRGDYAEYVGPMDVVSIDDASEPTERDLITEAARMVIAKHPAMKAGTVVRAKAKKLRG